MPRVYARLQSKLEGREHRAWQTHTRESTDAAAHHNSREATTTIKGDGTESDERECGEQRHT
jgi:hypothetical protein